MSGIEIDLLPELTRRHALVGWMLASFLLTFLATRAVTRAIREGRGPFRDMKLGGLHVHHQVYGIFLLIGAGTAEFTYRPTAPWADVLAVMFGIGAALTLDEFALWLHLKDVYWEREGRSSVDAALVALIVGALLFVGVNPFGDESDGGVPVVALGVAGNLTFALVAILKGRAVLGWSACSCPSWRWSPPCGWPARPHPGRAAATTSAVWRGRATGSHPGGAPAGTGSSTSSPGRRHSPIAAGHRYRSRCRRTFPEPEDPLRTRGSDSSGPRGSCYRRGDLRVPLWRDGTWKRPGTSSWTTGR